MKLINQALKTYLETKIIPQYKTLDLAHQPNHVYMVIEKSLDIAKDYEVDINMIYAIACFHDLGLLIDRKTHHIEGGKLLVKDQFIKSFFNEADIQIMKEAIEDHRASLKQPPRSIYGKIISEADRMIDPEMIIKRSFLYQMHLETNHHFDHLYPMVRNHIVEKYGDHGYLKLWLNYEVHTKILNEFRRIIKDEPQFKKLCKIYYEQLLTEESVINNGHH